MKFKVLTLFPEMFPGPLSFSVIGKALDKRLFELDLINYRDFSKIKPRGSMILRLEVDLE